MYELRERVQMYNHHPFLTCKSAIFISRRGVFSFVLLSVSLTRSRLTRIVPLCCVYIVAWNDKLESNTHKSPSCKINATKKKSNKIVIRMNTCT